MKLCYIIGAAIAVGSVAEIIYLIKKSDKENNRINNELELKSLESEKNTTVLVQPEKVQEDDEVDIDLDGAITEFTGRKINAIDNIVARHQDVSIIMRESLEYIENSNSPEELESKNREDLDKINDALDKLLEE